MENKLHANVYHRYPLTVVKGCGASLWDHEGNEYIDCMGGYGVAIVGHSNPKVVKAVKNQAERLITCHGSLYTNVRATLEDKIIEISPAGLDKLLLCNTGAEAVEAAIKLARKHTGRGGIVAMTGSYHGKTLGALSATWNQKYRAAFAPMVPEVRFTSFGKPDKVEAAVSKDTAAVIVEPVQGESGIHVSPDGFLSKVREICDKQGSLLIFDEVQSGFGRTGKMWASEHWDVTPDIMCTSKGIGGGLPLAATIGSNNVMSSFTLGDHTSTFGGNPLVCAAGIAAIDYMSDENLVDRAYRIGGIFRKHLEELVQKHRVAREVRGLGLMLALELRFDIKELIMKALTEGIILLYSGRNNLRFLPPLVISEEQITKVVKVLDFLLTKEDAKIPS